jgi:hypothetical protein
MRWNYDDPMLPGNQMAIDWYKANDLTVMAATSRKHILRCSHLPLRSFSQ